MLKRRPPGRRGSARPIAAPHVVGLVAAGISGAVYRWHHANLALYTAAVGISPDGTVRGIYAADRLSLIPDTRVLKSTDPRSAQAAAAQLRWLNSGRIPGA